MARLLFNGAMPGSLLHRSRPRHVRAIKRAGVVLVVALTACGIAVAPGLGMPVRAASGSPADTGGYPYWDTQCIWAPYATEGSGYWCSNYDWGTIRNNATVMSLISPFGYSYRNCTDYAAWKLSSLGVPSDRYEGLGNANTWGAHAPANGVAVNGTPAIGSIAVDTSGEFGHVAFVAGISGSVITVTQYNVAGDGNYTVQTGTPGQLGFSEFVHFEVFESGLPRPLRLGAPSLRGLVAGHPVSAPAAAAGGSPPYSWSFAGGRLPPGMVFNPGTARVTGVPIAPGSTRFSIAVRDSAGNRVVGTATAAVAPGIEDLFVLGRNGAVWHDYVTTRGPWSGWVSLGAPRGVRLAPDVSAGIGLGGEENIFVRATNGTVWGNHYDGRGWASWSSLGAPRGVTLVSDVTIGTNPNGAQEIFARASNGSVWHDYAAGTRWSGWSNLGGARGAVLASNITVATDASGSEELFARANNDSIWHDYLTPRGTWSGWGDLGGARGTAIVTDLTVSIDETGHEEVFARASNGTIWHDYVTPRGSWSGWGSLGAPPGTVLGYALTVGINLHGDEELFARATNGSVWHRWVTSRGWSAWGNLGGAGSALTSDLTVAYNRSSSEELSARAANGVIMHDYFSSRGAWSGWEILGSVPGGTGATNIGDVPRGSQP
jgi:surface antigen